MFSFSVLAEGFALGGSLIIAIGSQNAFILRQGILRQHVLPLTLFCALADATLIALGVYGLGSLISGHPGFVTVMLWLGAAFLTAYGLMAWHRAYKGQSSLQDETRAPASLKQSLILVACFTLLNPHVYLDTVVLLGSLSLQYPLEQRVWFGTGAMLASFCWFLSLGYGARLLAPLFAKPIAWRVLDSLIGLTMLLLAAKLVFS